MPSAALKALVPANTVLAPALAGAGIGMSAGGSINAGNAAAAAGAAQQQSADYSAASLQQQATGTVAAASQQVAQQARQTQMQLSNAEVSQSAGAAAPQATDPSVNTVLGRIAGVGEFSALNELFNGQNRAAGLTNQSQLDTYQGTQEAQAGKTTQAADQTKAIATVLSGGASLFSKYGGGGINAPAAVPSTGAYNPAPSGFPSIPGDDPLQDIVTNLKSRGY